MSPVDRQGGEARPNLPDMNQCFACLGRDGRHLPDCIYGEARNLDDYALACATDALYHEQHPEHPIDRARWSHPAPIVGEARHQATVAVAAYLAALDRATRS